MSRSRLKSKMVCEHNTRSRDTKPSQHTSAEDGTREKEVGLTSMMNGVEESFVRRQQLWWLSCCVGCRSVAERSSFVAKCDSFERRFCSCQGRGRSTATSLGASCRRLRNQERLDRRARDAVLGLQSTAEYGGWSVVKRQVTMSLQTVMVVSARCALVPPFDASPARF